MPLSLLVSTLPCSSHNPLRFLLDPSSLDRICSLLLGFLASLSHFTQVCDIKFVDAVNMYHRWRRFLAPHCP